VIVNALASTAGGGLTYLRNVVPRLSQASQRLEFMVVTDSRVEQKLLDMGLERRLFKAVQAPGRGWQRGPWEQRYLHRLIKARHAAVLVSLGNFALLRSPVPQVLFCRSDLFYSPEFRADLLRRGRLGILLGNQVRKLLSWISVRQADVNVTPSAAFADRLRSTRGLTRAKFHVLPFGFDPVTFAAGGQKLGEDDRRRLRLGEDVCRIVLVSHYNYFRNFETLVRALPLIKQNGRTPVLLVLTARIGPGLRDGSYDTTAVARLVERLGVGGDLVMLGELPYSRIHDLLRACNLFVFPSYSETFGHPMVEAMASGLPVVAADLPVHREVCGEAALYFSVFDEQELANQCVKVLNDGDLQRALRERGLARARQFSWDDHVNGLVSVIESLLESRGRPPQHVA